MRFVKSIGVEGGGVEEQERLKGQVRDLLIGLGATEEEVVKGKRKNMAMGEDGIAADGEGIEKRPRNE